MTKIETIYNMWFKVWNVAYLPLIMDRQKWHIEGENLTKNDLVYFKLTDSPMAADWRFGKIEYTDVGRDGLVRRVGISYKNKDGDDEEDWRHSVVERPARACVKLMNIEDTSILDDMRKVRNLAEEILGNKVESVAITDGPEADYVSTDSNSGKCIEEVPHDVGGKIDKVPHYIGEEIKVSHEDAPVKVKLSYKRQKKKTQLERLKIESSCPDLTSQLKSPVNLKTPLYSVSSKNSTEVVWQAMQLEEDVGGVTAAIPANDKAMVAGGEQIQRLGWSEAGVRMELKQN